MPYHGLHSAPWLILLDLDPDTDCNKALQEYRHVTQLIAYSTHTYGPHHHTCPHFQAAHTAPRVVSKRTILPFSVTDISRGAAAIASQHEMCKCTQRHCPEGRDAPAQPARRQALCCAHGQQQQRGG
jgi:hypothetical protein